MVNQASIFSKLMMGLHGVALASGAAAPNAPAPYVFISAKKMAGVTPGVMVDSAIEAQARAAGQRAGRAFAAADEPYSKRTLDLAADEGADRFVLAERQQREQVTYYALFSQCVQDAEDVCRTSNGLPARATTGPRPPAVTDYMRRRGLTHNLV